MKYALVTGCDHGLGLSLCGGLLDRGYTVLAGRYDSDEKQIDSLAARHDGRLIVCDLDISSDESVKALAGDFPFSSLDLLINSAGILGCMDKGPDAPIDFDLIQRVINVNAVGTLRMTIAMLPWLRRGEGRTVVNISSEAGSIADCERVGWFGYCMSKAANNMQGALIHNTLRLEGGRVFQIHPGHVATYMRGHLDTTASIGPDEAAEGVLRTVLDGDYPAGTAAVLSRLSGKGDALVMKRALIIGTYENAAYHPFRGVDDQLVKALEGAFEATLTDDLNHLTDLSGYDLLVSYIDNLPAQWPEGVAESVLRFVGEGGGLLLLHYGICLSTLEPLEALIGGRFDHHPPQEPITFTPTSDGFLAGTEAFTISEEPYQFRLCADDLETVLEYEYRGERYIGGWLRTQGKGRVVYLAPGHSVQTFLLSAYQEMIRKGAMWAVGATN